MNYQDKDCLKMGIEEDTLINDIQLFNDDEKEKVFKITIKHI